MHKSLLLLLLAAFCFIAPLFHAQTAKAQTVAPQPCDPQFYRQMSNRAWLESEREIMQNQNLIFKADSVLDYVCFDKFVDKANAEGGAIFTHTAYFGVQPFSRNSAQGITKNLTDIILKTYNTYRDDNFDHDLLGGRGLHLGQLRTNPAKNLTASDTTSAYTCNVMHEVWKTAKCLNFVHNKAFEDTDGFYPFSEIKCAPGSTKCAPVGGYDTIIDTRNYPTKCNPAGPTFPTWTDASITAANKTEAYKFQTPLGTIFKDVFDKTLAGACGQPGIKTGVSVITGQAGATPHDDGVCTNPGCTFTANGTCI